MSVIITADSSSDIPVELCKRYNISILPFYINFQNESYKDGYEITRSELYKKVADGAELPKTSAISPGDYYDFFQEKLKEADEIVHFALSSEISSAYQNAKTIASELDNVYIIDSQNLTSAVALMVIKAAELAESGKNAQEIVQFMSDYVKRCDASFVLQTLDYMKKGGRCSSITALGSNILGIKPSLEMKNGKLCIGKKYKGKMKPVVMKYIKERLEGASVDNERIFVSNSGIDEEIMTAAYDAVVGMGIFKEVIKGETGCVISSHCGPGTFGIMFVRK